MFKEKLQKLNAPDDILLESLLSGYSVLFEDISSSGGGIGDLGGLKEYDSSDNPHVAEKTIKTPDPIFKRKKMLPRSILDDYTKELLHQVMEKYNVSRRDLIDHYMLLGQTMTMNNWLQKCLDVDGFFDHVLKYDENDYKFYINVKKIDKIPT